MLDGLHTRSCLGSLQCPRTKGEDGGNTAPVLIQSRKIDSKTTTQLGLGYAEYMGGASGFGSFSRGPRVFISDMGHRIEHGWFWYKRRMELVFTFWGYSICDEIRRVTAIMAYIACAVDIWIYPVETCAENGSPQDVETKSKNRRHIVPAPKNII